MSQISDRLTNEQIDELVRAIVLVIHGIGINDGLRAISVVVGSAIMQARSPDTTKKLFFEMLESDLACLLELEGRQKGARLQ